MINSLYKNLKQLIEKSTTLSRKLFNFLLHLLRGAKHLLEKVLAYFLLCHLYLIYFAATKAGFVVLFLTAGFGVLGLRTTSEGYYYLNIVEAACVLSILYLYLALAVLFILFRIPGFERWSFKHIGEERVRRLAYH